MGIESRMAGVMKNLFYGLVALVLLGTGAAYSGVFSIAADRPHFAGITWFLEMARTSSIERHARDIEVPELGKAEQLLGGGADYEEMCSSCHLAPGRPETDLSAGLYPRPPNLSQPRLPYGSGEDQARHDFWVIKHGIMASGMPAWGSGHDDERIWSMVSFLRKLPELDANAYAILTARTKN
jgi:mono/diheme cytochrome c family protein